MLFTCETAIVDETTRGKVCVPLLAVKRSIVESTLKIAFLVVT